MGQEMGQERLLGTRKIKKKPSGPWGLVQVTGQLVSFLLGAPA